jgi:hypothetical protein
MSRTRKRSLTDSKRTGRAKRTHGGPSYKVAYKLKQRKALAAFPVGQPGYGYAASIVFNVDGFGEHPDEMNYPEIPDSSTKKGGKVDNRI